MDYICLFTMFTKIFVLKFPPRYTYLIRYCSNCSLSDVKWFVTKKVFLRDIIILVLFWNFIKGNTNKNKFEIPQNLISHSTWSLISSAQTESVLYWASKNLSYDFWTLSVLYFNCVDNSFNAFASSRKRYFSSSSSALRL